jgi:superfamily II DNA or RNA helicase
LQRPSGFYTESTKRQALSLLGKVLEGYEFHPFFFILNLNLNTNADPPILPFAHQTELLFRLAFRKPVRVLIGDEIGLGKTIEAILAVKFLEYRDGVRRILLLVPRILVEQWRSELKRFGIHARVIERRNISVLAQQGFAEGWYIASIDLVKREEHKPKITSVDWDVVIVDEAHRVGKTRSSQKSITQRYELVEELTKVTNRNIILLSATPHRGHATDYISRLKLVDPYLIGEKELDNDSFYRLTRDSIVIRRTKMDVNEVYEHRQIFKKARFVARVISATLEETEFNELLFRFLRDKLLKYYEYIGEEPKALPLLLALIAKRASSSPYAAMRTLERMLHRRSLVVEGKALSLIDASKLDEEAESIVEAYLGLGFEDYGEVGDLEEAVEPDEPINRFVEKCGTLLEEQDLEVIERLFSLARSIAERNDSRLKGVFKLIHEHLGKGDKIVVFTEYKDTARYIYEKLKEEMPDIISATALITSDGIIIPGWRGRRRPSIEDLKRYLRLGRIKLIISTDVASEGLNLQVANIIINYEPTWSPIKVEQRLGRVWRLGQEKEVTSYTLFLAIRSDKDVLDVLYKKLLAWGRSLQESRVAIGEEVIIDMMTEEGSTTIPIDVAKGTPRYSEYKALLTYIREGRSGLEHYVQSIINALASLKKNLERVGLTRRNITFKIERLLSDVLGDFRGDSVDRVLKELFMVAAKLKGVSIKVEGDRIFAGTFRLNNIHDFYSSTVSLLPDANSMDRPVYLVSSAQLEGLKELHLFKVTIFFKNKPVYSETVGIGVKASSTELLRGRRLLNIIIRALSPGQVLSSVEEYYVSNELLQAFKVRASKTVLNRVAPVAVKELTDYMSKLERLGFSTSHQDWEPRDTRLYSDRSEYLGAIIFTTPSEASTGTVPPIKVKEVEEAAMKLAMEYEKESGRIPEDVSMREHFDILSRNPRTGEVRFIEVKGKSGLDLEIELTETEFMVAKEKGEKYWLYIVYGIRTGKPRLLAVRDPINNMKWREVSVRRYRFKPE